MSGITPTAGGIVMGGDNAGNFLTLNSDTGEVIKKVATGGSLSGGLITYEQQGKQYVAFTSGNFSRTVMGVYGRPTLIVMALPKSAVAKADTNQRLSFKPDVGRGQKVFIKRCAACHGAKGERTAGIDLARTSEKWTREQLSEFIIDPTPTMPKTFAEPRDKNDKAELRDLVEYVFQLRP